MPHRALRGLAGLPGVQLLLSLALVSACGGENGADSGELPGGENAGGGQAASGASGQGGTTSAGGASHAGASGQGQAAGAGAKGGAAGHGGQAGGGSGAAGGGKGAASGAAGSPDGTGGQGDEGGAGGQGDEGGAGGQEGAGKGGAAGKGSAGKGGEAGTAGAAGKGETAKTCAKAGGNRCGKTQDACDGLTSFDSSDCTSCCLVPSNPIIDSSYADPFIVREGSTYYAFATGSTVRRRASKDLEHWEAATDALTKAPWKDKSGGFWAPTVYKAKNGKWVMYFAAETSDPNNKQHCIGKATASAIDGDFSAQSSTFICAKSAWSIDPSVFRDDDGADYLLWRQDTAAMPHGNAYIQRLDASGELTGTSHELISRASKEPSWEFDSEGGVLENPAMVRHGKVYHLFYSGNRWETAKYANGHATCDTPFGPCKKTSTVNPWQGSKGQMLGPGGADTVKAADGTLLMYMHGWDAPKVDKDGGTRKLWLYRLNFDGQTPVLAPL